MSVNKVFLLGHLGKDPDLRTTPSGTAVCTFSLATSERFKDKQGQQQEKTEWHNIVAWAGLGETCGKSLHKGKKIYIEGKIQNCSYEDHEGIKRYISEVIINNMNMLGGKENNQKQETPNPWDEPIEEKTGNNSDSFAEDETPYDNIVF